MTPDEQRRERQRERKRLRYATDPEYAERERERKRLRRATDPEFAERERERQRLKYATDPEFAERERKRNRERQRMKRATDPEFVEREREQRRERQREWHRMRYATDPEFVVKKTIRSRKRRAKKINAVPPWGDTPLAREIRRDLERRRKELERITGLKWHLDHIVPLQHDDVCGLDCPDNWRLITKGENLSKSNKLIEELAQPECVVCILPVPLPFWHNWCNEPLYPTKSKRVGQ